MGIAKANRLHNRQAPRLKGQSSKHRSKFKFEINLIPLHKLSVINVIVAVRRVGFFSNCASRRRVGGFHNKALSYRREMPHKTYVSALDKVAVFSVRIDAWVILGFVYPVYKDRPAIGRTGVAELSNVCFYYRDD